MSSYLMIFIEPTPYLLGLIEEIIKNSDGQAKVLFLRENSTQQWNVSIAGIQAEVLPTSFLAAMIYLHHIIHSGRFRVIHLAGWSEKLILFSMITAWLHRIPTVVESDTPLPVAIAPWKRFAKRLAYPLLFKIPSMFLPGGTRQANYFRHYGVADERIRIAHMTVDVTHIMKRCSELGETGRLKIRQELGFSQSDVVIVFVGRLIDRKGLDVLMESFDIFSRKLHTVKLLLVGDGPLRKKIEYLAEASDSIRYVGRLDTDGVIEMFHASDIAVVPSIVEPWGLVVNEAMAAGLPVIASDAVGCVDDLLHENSTGKIVKTNSVGELVNAIQYLAENGEARTGMGLTARVMISEWTLRREAKMVLNAWSVAAAGLRVTE